MFTHRKLTTVCCAAVLALGLAACGSSNKAMVGKPTPTPPPPATELAYADVSAGLNVQPGTYDVTDPPQALVDAVEGFVPEDSYAAGDEIELGPLMLKCADTSTDGCTVTVNDDGTLTTTGIIQVVRVGGMYKPLKTTGGSPLDLDAKQVAAAIDMNDAILPNSGSPNLPFTAVGGKIAKLTDDPGDEFEKSETTTAPGITDWDEAVYTRSVKMAAGVDASTTTVVSYTDIDDPTAQAYSVYYATNATFLNRDAVTGATNGVLDIDNNDIATNHELFMLDEPLTTGPYQTVPIEHDDPDTTDVETESSFDGMFNDVPGTFKCTGACMASSDKDGYLSGLAGTWTFTPDAEDLEALMVAGVVPDPDYLDFGYWVVATTDADGDVTYAVGTFGHGNAVYGSTSQLEGTAEYAGDAAGVYMTKTFDPNTGSAIPGEAGQFTAKAALTAYFMGGAVTSNDRFKVSGTITDFVNNDGGTLKYSDGEKWKVDLMKGDSELNNGSFAGMTSGGTGTDPGEYAGNFYGSTTPVGAVTPMPSAAAGTFNAHFSNGHAAGGFGARKTPE